MKKNILSSTIVLSLFIFSINAFAQTDYSASNLTNREDKKALIEEQKTIFKQKLSVIRDERKKALVDRIDGRIEKLNKNYVARFFESIKKLEAILNRLKEKTAMFTASGADVSMVDNAIANAQTAIDRAKISLGEQEAKVYNIEVSSETGLKANVGRTVSEFRKDLRDVHKKVVDAKQAVRNVEKELAKIRGEGQE